MKKIISVILCIILFTAVVPLNALAEVTETSGSYQDKMTWEYDKSTKTLTVTCNGALDFPYEEVYEYMEGPIFLYKAYPWNKNGISGEAEHIVLKGNVTEIGDSVFMNFWKLKELNIPKSVTKIDSLAYRGCGFEEIDIPSNVKTIGTSAFGYCNSLKKVVLHEGLEYIGDYAFNSNYLEEINIPSTVNMTGSRIVGEYFNENLKKIIQSEGGFCYIDNCIVGGQYDVENAVIREGTRFVPENLCYYISSRAYKTLYVPSSVKTIGTKAFYGRGLESVTLANGVETICDEAFTGNSNLTKITFSDSIKEIGKKAFYGAGFTSVKLPAGLESIDEEAFANTKLTSVNLPKNLKWLSAKAFSNSPIEKITVDKNNAKYTVVDNVLFSKNKKSLVYYPSQRAGKHYIVPSGVTNIYADFTAAKLQTVTVPKTVIKILAYIEKSLYYFGTEEEWNKIQLPTKKKYYYGNETVTLGARYCTAKLGKTKYIYKKNKVRTPKVNVYDPAGNLLKEKQDYTVTYPKGRKKINEYTVKVKLKGKYKGSFNLAFRIAPRGTDFTKITPGGAKFTARWKKINKNITGYEIQFSTDQKFRTSRYANPTKTYTVKKKKNKKVFNNLSVNKPYYIRIRTFKKVKNKRVYSSWSKGKKVQISSPY